MKAFLKEALGLLKDVTLLARDFSAQRFQELEIQGRFSRVVGILTLAAVGLLILSLLASSVGLSGLADAAFLLLELLVTGIVLLAVVALSAVYEAGQQFAATRRFFQICASGALAFFLVALALYWLPRTPAVLFLVLLATIIVTLFIVRFGIGPSPLSAYLVFGVLMTLSLVQASVVAIFPETSRALREALSVVDTRAARSLGTSVLPSPPRLEVQDPDDLGQIQFFDSQGPLVFYSRTTDGGFELFAGQGNHPQTGETLKPMTDEAWRDLKEWIEKEQKRRLAETPLPAPERLRYESISQIEFFDSVSGDPRVWFAELSDGTIELFTGPGIHPVYRIELQAVTPETVDVLRQQEAASQPRPAPKKITYGSVADVEFFDRVTGGPLVWYAEIPDGSIELFSGPGVHPVYRMALTPADADTPRLVQQALARQARAATAASARAAEVTRQTELARKRERYLQPGCREARTHIVAVVRGSESQPAFADAVAREIGGRADCFTPAFVGDGLFQKAFEGDSALLREADLGGAAKSIVLVTLSSVQQSVNPAGRDMVKIDISAGARFFRPQSSYSSVVSTANASGVGFAAAQAELQALDRLLEQLVTQVRPLLSD